MLSEHAVTQAQPPQAIVQFPTFIERRLTTENTEIAETVHLWRINWVTHATIASVILLNRSLSFA